MSKKSKIDRYSLLRKRLEKVFLEDVSARKAHDIAFHLLDWINDLDELYELLNNIESKTDDEVRDVIIGFLIHAPHHLNAAKYLYGLGGVEDLFELGLIPRKTKKRK